MAQGLAPRVKRYIWVSFLPAAAVIVAAMALDPRPSVEVPWLIYPLLVAIGWAGEEYRVRTRQNAHHTLTAAIHPPFILLLTPFEAIAVAAISCVCAQVRRRRSPYHTAYNAVVRVISVGIPSLLLALWRTHDHRFGGQRAFLSVDILGG